MTWVSPDEARRSERMREARIALSALLPHVYLACGGAGEQPCEWCQVLVAFDHAEACHRRPYDNEEER